MNSLLSQPRCKKIKIKIKKSALVNGTARMLCHTPRKSNQFKTANILSGRSGSEKGVDNNDNMILSPKSFSPLDTLSLRQILTHELTPIMFLP
jgi:hypothetical protein